MGNNDCEHLIFWCNPKSDTVQNRVNASAPARFAGTSRWYKDQSGWLGKAMPD
jgi:hypothetical protein